MNVVHKIVYCFEGFEDPSLEAEAYVSLQCPLINKKVLRNLDVRMFGGQGFSYIVSFYGMVEVYPLEEADQR